MAIIMPEIATQIIIKQAVEDLKTNETRFKKIFESLNCEGAAPFYGTSYIDDIWQWFRDTKIPVLQAFSFDADKVPCYAIHLSTEAEDESKASTGDFLEEGEDNDVLVGVDQVALDIMVIGHRNKDTVLWLHYILKYILFTYKMQFVAAGMQLHTYSVTDYNKMPQYMTENIWARTVRMRTIVVNTFENTEEYIEIDDIDTFVQADDLDVEENLVPEILPERFRG